MVSPPEYYPLSLPAAPLLLISAALAFLGGDADSSACCYFIPYSSFHDRQLRVRKSARSTISSVLGGILIVLLAVLLAVSVKAVVHRLLPLPLRASDIAAISTIYAAVCVIYGMTLAFSTFLVWNEIHDLQTTEYEAGNVEDLYRLAGQFVEPERG
jgi:hypothetical protein